MDSSAGILIIGDEILAGTFAEKNASYLIGELRGLGVNLRRIEFIADDEAEIGESVVRLAERCRWVFTSGGVGPTHDDVTIAAIAKAFETPVVTHPELIALLEGYYGTPLQEGHRRLAQVPEGAELVFGDPRWPVIQFRNVHILPGVPALFRKCFDSIRETFRGRAAVVARVYCGCDETELATLLESVAEAHPGAKFGSYPRWGEADYKVLITVEGLDAESVNEAAYALRTALGRRVSRFDPAPAA